VILFSGAIVLLALHAAADGFVAPEPGTGPRDHLLRGLAAFTILALAALAYPRSPAGGRAAVSAVFGVLALVGAALAIAGARAVGARGEDWTGFLLLPLGVALLATAAVLLWRSRKPGRLRYLRRAGIAFAAVLAAYWLVVPVAIAILATHRPRADVAPAELGRPYEELTIRTSDGLDLAAWYVPSLNGAAVISYPTRRGKMAQARMLVRHGYGVLLLDARGYDGSEGDPNLFGWAGARDIDAAVSWLQGRPAVTGGRIGGIGFSVGGEMMLQAAASNRGLRAVVSEGAGVGGGRGGVNSGPPGGVGGPPDPGAKNAGAGVWGARAAPPRSDDGPPRSPPTGQHGYAGGGGGGGGR
jgi:hypothetical protein